MALVRPGVIFALLAFVAVQIALTRFVIANAKKSNSGKNLVIVSDQNIQLEGESQKTDLKWAGISSATQTPDGFLLRRGDGHFHWLPRNGFEYEAAFEKCAELLRRNVAKFKVMR